MTAHDPFLPVVAVRFAVNHGANSRKAIDPHIVAIRSDWDTKASSLQTRPSCSVPRFWRSHQPPDSTAQEEPRESPITPVPTPGSSYFRLLKLRAVCASE